MVIRQLASLIILILIIMLSGCKQNEIINDTEADKQAIRELYNNRYFKGVNTKDLDLFMTSWADDATRMEAEFFPIVGKEKIRAHFKNVLDSSLDGLEIKSYGNVEIEVENDLAFTRGAVTIEGISAFDSSEVFLDIKWLDILKKQSDGTWKIYIDCVNYNPDVSKKPDNEDPGEDRASDPAL